MYNHYDNKKQPALNTKKAIKKYIEQSIEQIRIQTKNDTKYCRAFLEFEKHMEKRRIIAVMNSIEIIKKEHEHCIEDWIRSNIFSMSYKKHDEMCHILLASSIWILDVLSNADIQFDELYKLLPRNKTVITPLIRENLSVCGYSPELTASVEYVLRYRNSDIPSTPSCENKSEQVLTNNISAVGTIDHSVPSRQNFEKLLSLIPQEKIESAVNKFRECYDEWCKRYFYGVEYFNSLLNEERKKYDEIRSSFNQFEASVKTVTSNNKLISSPSDVMKSITETKSSAYKYGEKLIELLKNVDILKKQKEAFILWIYNNGTISQKICDEGFDGNLNELIEPMPSADPYELCFALLYLIEQDDDIPWLYGSCIGMLRGYLSELPWCTTNNNSNINEADYYLFSN